MNIMVDRGLCEIHAQCVYAAPEVFALDEEDELVYDPTPDSGHLDAVREAIAVCPVQAIALRESQQ